jgi:hypothetical protein
MPKTMEKEASAKPKKEIPKQYLEVAAYYHWQQRGCPLNDDLADWLAVEKEWAASRKKKWWFFRPDALPFLARI